MNTDLHTKVDKASELKGKIKGNEAITMRSKRR